MIDTQRGLRPHPKGATGDSGCARERPTHVATVEREFAMNFRLLRPSHCLAVVLAAVVAAGAGCAKEDWNLDWLTGGNRSKQRRPVTKGRQTGDQPRTAQARQAGEQNPDDRQARDVNEQMARYAERMEQGDQNPPAKNDFNDKIRRQQDPNRRQRIRKVADRTREEPAAQDEPVVRPVVAKQSPGSDEPAPVPPSVKADRAEVEPAPAPAQSKPTAVEPDAEPSTNSVTDPNVGTDEPEAVSPATPENEAEAGTSISPNAPVTAIDDATGKSDKSDKSGKTSPPSTGDPAQTPVLDPNIRVSAGPEPSKQVGTETEQPVDMAQPVANAAPESAPPVDTFKQRFEELESRVKAEPNNLEARYSFIMMCLADGQEEKALASVDGTDSELQEMVQAHVRALIAAQSSPGRDPARIANYQLQKLEELRNIVRSRADLHVPKVVLCTAIDGFGRYTPIEPAEFKAGQKNWVLLYIEVDNFHSEKTSSGLYRTLLSVRQSLLTKSGEELWNTHDANIEDLARRRRHDFYLTVGPLAIPSTLGPGEYVLKVEVEDVLAGKINSEVGKFRMVP